MTRLPGAAGAAKRQNHAAGGEAVGQALRRSGPALSGANRAVK